MRRDDDAFWTLREQIAERNAVDRPSMARNSTSNPLRAVIQRRGQDQAALLFASVEVPTLPHRAAGHDRGHTPALECAAHVELATPSRRNSTMSPLTAASRAARSSAIDRPVTVSHKGVMGKKKPRQLKLKGRLSLGY
jgi:hypothetical protein